jgi:hypothetical protein
MAHHDLKSMVEVSSDEESLCFDDLKRDEDMVQNEEFCPNQPTAADYDFKSYPNVFMNAFTVENTTPLVVKYTLSLLSMKLI